ncbi:MAG: CDP-glycerol glycerophosphotransferase family protein [Bacilli bacterium]|jgi:CDP-glycerol glycerophosphotransferase (TagB/SpsB family)/glycosyltransferase involved in cell wall biosynthesis|nr:CDP-glycerol glycerophosphotransferase family protein [Bacilli bacterium]
MDCEIKKTLLLVPTAYSKSALGDVINFVDYYYQDFNVYIILKDISDDVHCLEHYRYKVVKDKTSLAENLKLTADYVIDAGTLNIHSKRNFHGKWVSVWHGIPYKKMFNDFAPEEINNTINYGNAYDVMISMSPFYTNTFLRKAMMYDGEILELGCSKIDSLFAQKNKVNDIKKKLNLPLDKKIILYAPTYQKDGAYQLPFDVDKLLNSISDNEEYVLVTKLHYLSKLEGRHHKVIDKTNYSQIIDLMIVSDMLISDYSSLIIDYSLLNKPIVLFQYNQEEYFKDRGVYFDFKDFINPKQIVTTEDELYNVLQTRLDCDNTKLSKYFYPYENGTSTKKIVEALNFDTSKRHTKDIIFLINDLNEIGGIHSFIKNMARYYKEHYNSKIIVLAIKEFANNPSGLHFIDTTYLDIAISYEKYPGTVKSILWNNDGYFITLQFSAHLKFQGYLKNNKNSILMFHGDTKDVIKKELYGWHLDALNNNKLHNYKYLAFLTKSNADLIRPYLNKEVANKLIYIPNSTIEAYHPIESKNYNNFAYIGRLANDKNIFGLIDLGIAIKKQNKKFKINIYGTGPEKEAFEEEIKVNKLDNILILKGYESNKEKIFIENCALILVSKSEGLPLTIIEAYAYGKPAIIFNSFTAASDVVDDKKTGFLIEPFNYDEFAYKMSEINKLNIDDTKNKYEQFSNETIFSIWNELFRKIDQEELLQKKLNNNVNKEDNNKIKSKRNINNIVRRKYKRLKRNVKKVVFNQHRMSEYYNYVGNKREKNILSKMTNKPLVSIIIPNYHSSATIEQTIKSVLAQKYPNIEMIIVNDGPEDTINDIVNKYPLANINYYIKEHGGLGLTRNYGIEKAKGEFVFFLDSDDVIYKGAITCMVNYLLVNNIDVVSARTVRFNVDNKSVSDWFLTLYKKNKIIDHNNILPYFSDTLSTNKMYRKQMLLDNNILFEEGLYEDKLFTAKLYNKIEKLGILNQPVYQWNVREAHSSITTSKTVKNYQDRMETFDKLWHYIEESQKPYILRFAINHDTIIYIREYLTYSDKDKKELFKTIGKIFCKYDYYIYPRILFPQRNFRLISYALDNNFERFDELARIIAYNYKELNIY